MEALSTYAEPTHERSWESKYPRTIGSRRTVGKYNRWSECGTGRPHRDKDHPCAPVHRGDMAKVSASVLVNGVAVLRTAETATVCGHPLAEVRGPRGAFGVARTPEYRSDFAETLRSLRSERVVRSRLGKGVGTSQTMASGICASCGLHRPVTRRTRRASTGLRVELS